MTDEKMSRDGRIRFVLGALATRPALLCYNSVTDLHDELEEKGYDAARTTLWRDLKKIREEVSSVEFAEDSRIHDVLIVNSELARVLDDNNHTVADVVRLVELRGKLLGYGNVVVESPTAPKRNKYLEREGEWQGNNPKPNNEQP